MRILLIGASGLVGSHIHAEALKRGYEITGTYRNFPITGLVKLDLEDKHEARRLVEKTKPDWIIHAGGWTWVDGCESDPAKAFRENSEQPLELAALCREVGCKMVYVSTTYIFDGNAGPYSETDKPNPINAYARSKYDAEQKLSALLGDSLLIPRVICVWGKEHQKKNFVYQTIKALQEKRVSRLPSDQYGNPTWAGDIAWWMLQLMENNHSGIWNLAGAASNMSRVEWFSLIRDAAVRLKLVGATHAKDDYLAIPTVELQQAALRPLHAGAKTDKIQNTFPRKTRTPDALEVLT